MRFKTILLLWMALSVFGDSLAGQDEQKANKEREEKKQTVLVHFMPWYASKPVSGQWGWHWTMDHFDPEKIDDAGRREIASHDYPLIGPYDSSDPHVLECQVLQMKLAGIDGVIIDWYGIGDLWDYPMNHRNTQLIIKYCKMAGLKFAICYEDQTVPNLVKQKVIDESSEIAHGKETIKWMEDNWFHDDAYVKLDGKPVLLVFGPQHYQSDAWSEMLAVAKPCPSLFALPHLTKNSKGDGAFGWPPVSGGVEITPAKWNAYLNDLYARKKNGESIIAPAFPGFRDIYEQAGTQKTHGFIDDRNGKTFAETLNMAIASNSPLVQIATWNDYGEGTMIEPTKALGYQYLEMIQKTRDSVSYTPEDLRMPTRIYQLRKQYASDETVMKNLKTASELLFHSQCEAARTVLKQLSVGTE